MSRADDALQALYEDASLRDELGDEEANTLLKWAAGELAKLGDADESVFEEKTRELRRLLRGMNRFVGRRAEITAQADDTALLKLSEHANALGYALSPDQLAEFAAQGAALDGVSAVQALTRLISGTAADAAQKSSVSTEGEQPAVALPAPAPPDFAPAEPSHSPPPPFPEDIDI
jgi:hypothetical protein